VILDGVMRRSVKMAPNSCFRAMLAAIDAKCNLWPKVDRVL